MTEPLDAELLKDMRGLGKPLSFDGNDAEYQDFRFSFRIHMSLVSTVSGSREIAGRCTPEVLHTDVLFVGLDNERQCPNSCPIC